jgi:hypothetical protein
VVQSNEDSDQVVEVAAIAPVLEAAAIAPVPEAAAARSTKRKR